jgi:hypothetical protein
MAGFEVRDVSGWEAVNPETIGRDAKLWVREPGAPSSSRERDWLFKPVIVTASGHRQGEDWTEKIVSELGGLLGVPCAEIELAVRRGVPGSHLAQRRAGRMEPGSRLGAPQHGE